MSKVQREPALVRHPAEDLPERPRSRTAPEQAPAPQIRTSEPVQAAAPKTEERLTEQHNVRIRPSTKQRLVRAVDKLRYETGDRTISIASITDRAIDQFLTERNC